MISERLSRHGGLTHSRTEAGEARAKKPDTTDVCQYDVEHERVMFSSVKAAICV